jgi:hypothetical protein
MSTSEQKARAFVAREAPLSVTEANVIRHANMIKRGFKSHYTATVRREGSEILVGPAKFGHEDYVKENGDFDQMEPSHLNFALVGLPPQKDTKVWLRYCGPSSGSPPQCLAFASWEEAVSAKVDINSDPFMGVADEASDEEMDAFLRDIRANGHTEREGVLYGVALVLLP